MNICKISLIGPNNCGKTSIIKRYIDDQFIIGDDFFLEESYFKIMKIKEETYKLELVECNGFDDDYSNFNNIIKNSDSIIIVFSLTNKDSFQEIKNHSNRILFVKGLNSYEIILVGNKKDLTEFMEVSNEEMNELLKDLNCKYYETSAKQNINIDNIFIESVKIYQKKQILQN